MKWKVVLFLVLLGGTMTFGQVADVRYDAYGSWVKTSRTNQLVWVNGVLSGVHYLAVRFATEKKDDRILQYVPNYVPSTTLQDLIDDVYSYQEYRSVPIVDIVIRSKMWMEIIEARDNTRRKL